MSINKGQYIKSISHCQFGIFKMEKHKKHNNCSPIYYKCIYIIIEFTHLKELCEGLQIKF